MASPDPWANVARLPGGSSITIVEGDAFVVSDPLGDIRPGTVDGLYHRDTRFLSAFRLLVDGHPPELLAGGTVDSFSARIYLRPTRETADSAPIVIERRASPATGSTKTLSSRTTAAERAPIESP